MFTKLEIWLQVFLAALQALLQQPGTTTHSAISTARAVADEAQGHMPAGMLQEPKNEPSTGSAILPAPETPIANSSTTDTGALAAAIADNIPESTDKGEDDLERDRR